MRTLLTSLFCLLAVPAVAETLIAARTIRAQMLLSAQDLLVSETTIPGALANLEDAVGQEARVTIYAGRPVRTGDVGPPAIVDRNDIVTLIFEQGGLRITSDGRSLGRGGEGDRIRVMNLSSRTSVFGQIDPQGQVVVSQ
ncbi:flagellar basal body P-ring formation chaperone FlgA [Primorskyibacter flagellatus]|uniref:Flagella basal body P-ring formation protein FlgA n=1 Tax=Primorskyibacter flagellatus TaxID=1387277 RepID=A0A1W2A8Q8_9RHOB|nr:flagellar basal body P-ring formation chaperone FlgA [Primorskyibacter flagellatus]SMC56852.1 flagella basal body P-ring formation protein FlgA [Primorskyibacter flagellatus]